jgi:hypothetical protein
MNHPDQVISHTAAKAVVAYTKRNYPAPNLSLFNRERIIEYLHGKVPELEAKVHAINTDPF